MDLAAFAKFCETSSIARCRAVGGQQSPRWVGRITVDADNNKIMLEAVEQRMRNQELILDLHKAAQAGKVDGVFMIACTDGGTSLEAVVIDNSETWTGHADCLNKPVELVPDKARQLETLADLLDISLQSDRFSPTSRISRHVPLTACNCGGDDEAGVNRCRNDKEPGADNDMPVVDIATLLPARAAGQLEQAMVAAAGVASTGGQLALGRLAWDATGPDQRNMFRSWQETFTEATGERNVTWVPDLFDIDWRRWTDGLNRMLAKRPVCVHTNSASNSTRRRPCPAFLTSTTATNDTIRVPAHVDNVSLADAGKLVVNGADLAEAVAVISVITRPGRT